jgi:flavin reductase (DIM6/NTAB) family NADH-FMN oxidoreductase RutF/pimeloyl-ACP methyl ester carboxylesterase
MEYGMERVEFEGFGGVRLVGNAFGKPDDPAVLLVPSAGQVREFWYGSAQALADAGRYAICVDLRGHGDSGKGEDLRYDLVAFANDLKAILNALPSRAFIVAAGLGALAAIAAVGEGAAHIVSGLALVDASIWFDEAVFQRLAAALKKRSTVFDTAEAVLDAFAASHPTEPRPAESARILTAFARREDGRYVWRGDPRAISMRDLRDLRNEQDRLSVAVSRIVAPVTLIRGSLNETISEETLRRLQALIPGAEVAELAGVGHYAAADREDAFNSVLLDFLERAAPRRPLTYLSGSEPRILRDALGCFATGVTIVTTLDANGAPLGLTANSFTSVSLDPPLILFSLLKKSANLNTFTQAGRFAVNVLQIGQQPAAGRFAQRDGDRFAAIDWSVREAGGSPLLAGSLASFDCRTYAMHDGGDHLIFIGEVIYASFEPRRDPLLYFRGKFQRLHFS